MSLSGNPPDGASCSSFGIVHFRWCVGLYLYNLGFFFSPRSSRNASSGVVKRLKAADLDGFLKNVFRGICRLAEETVGMRSCVFRMPLVNSSSYPAPLAHHIRLLSRSVYYYTNNNITIWKGRKSEKTKRESAYAGFLLLLKYCWPLTARYTCLSALFVRHWLRFSKCGRT